MTLQEKFENAVGQSKQLPQKPDNETLLTLYSLYKQATEGDAPESAEFGMFDFVAKAKYEAWKKISGSIAEQAMEKYIALVEQLKG